jgi:hypothetical protein
VLRTTGFAEDCDKAGTVRLGDHYYACHRLQFPAAQ